MSDQQHEPLIPPLRLDKVQADRQAVAKAFDDLLAMQHDGQNPNPLAAKVSRLARPHQVLKLLLERMADYNLTTVQAVVMVINAASEASSLFLLDALRDAAYNPLYTDALRLSAVSVLCYREGQPVPDNFLVNLHDPATAALTSLRATLAEAMRNPTMQMDYLSGLSQSEVEVQTTFITMMKLLDDPLVVLPLRVMAQDDRPSVADPALEALAALKHEAAATTLLTLPPVLRPERRTVAERAVRKMQMSVAPGQTVPLLPTQPHPASRAFLSLIDSRGSQMVWFACPQHAAASEFDLINVLLNERAGVKGAVGAMTVVAAALPQPMRVGAMHHTIVRELSENALRHDIAERVQEMVTMGEMIEVPPELAALLQEIADEDEPPFLEVNFDYARRLLLEAQAETWSSGGSLPVDYKVFSEPIWRSQPPGPDAAKGPELPLPARLRSGQELTDAAMQLLDSPYFVGWFLETPMLYDEVERLLQMMPKSGKLGNRKQAQLERTVDEIRELLISTHYRPEQIEALQLRLTKMAEWLTIAGERGHAALALGIARSLSIEPAASHPFIVMMVQRGVEVAAESLASGLDLRDDPARFGYIS